MSITDELRKVAAKTECANGRCEKLYRGDLESIADRIDAEHERMLGDWDYWESTHVKLPKDADGVPIHVGDVMEWIDLDGEVTVTCSVDAVGVDCFFAWDKGNRRYAQKCANAYRHHHAPTVEDVLTEFTEKMNENLGMYIGEAIDADEWRSADAETIAEYASKLRLAEGEDE